VTLLRRCAAEGLGSAFLIAGLSLADAPRGGLRAKELLGYVSPQLAGALVGVAIANAMFGLPLFPIAHRHRSGAGLWLGEFVATFGLLLVIWGCVRFRSTLIAPAVAAYIVPDPKFAAL
jgi:glycerol uptake facilitator-like aquaporin